jgi:hypothetical protein
MKRVLVAALAILTLAGGATAADKPKASAKPNSTTTRKLTTDGQPAALELNGFPAVCSAVWDGKDIIATTNMESAGLKFMDRMSLSADGKTLTSKVQIASAQGNGDVTIVFDRQ